MKKLTEKQFEDECEAFVRDECLPFFKKLLTLHDKGVENKHEDSSCRLITFFNALALDLTSADPQEATTNAIAAVLNYVAKDYNKKTGKRLREEDINDIVTALIARHPHLQERLFSYNMAMLENGEGEIVGIPQHKPEPFPSYVG